MAASALVEPVNQQNGAAAQEEGSMQQGKSPAGRQGSATAADAVTGLNTDKAEPKVANGNARQKGIEASAINKPSIASSVSLTASGQTQNGKQHGKSATAAAPEQALAAARSQQAAETVGLPTATPVATTTAPDPALTREAAIERLEGLLRRLSAEHDPEGFFRERVSTELKGCENYYDRIKSPMWLSLISNKLRSGGYRTLNQLQADLELICSNAVTFNLKPSKVYKNAQALSKASRKQFQIERALLLEAIAVLHPGGLEAARKDQADEEKSLKFAPPPKKPAKPSKPPKKPPSISGLTGGSIHVGGSGNFSQLISSPSSGNLAAFMDAQRSLPTLGEAEDLLVDVHVLEKDGYSSFSDSEDEKSLRKATDRMGGHTEAQAWRRNHLTASPAAVQAAAASSGQLNPWKSKRRCTEWRVRWLELRLRELKYQQTRYEHLLKLVQNPAAAAAAEQSAAQPSTAALPQEPSSSFAEEGPSSSKAKPLAAQDFRTPEALAREQKLGTVQASTVWTRAGDDEPPWKKQRRQRQVVRELGKEQLLDHPFFAAEYGFRKNKQVVREAEDADVSDDDVNYPARVYAAAELLERHCLGLRELLCQPEPESRLPGKQPFKGGGRGRTAVGRGRGTHGKAGARSYRRSQEGVSSGFLVHGLPSQQLDLGKPIKDILIPKYREHSLEELHARAELLAAWEARAAKKKAGSLPIAEAEAPHAVTGRDVDIDGESSSSEDTSDEAFARTHTIEEERERAKYEGEATKKKRNKTKMHNSATEAGAPLLVPQPATVAPTVAGGGLVLSHLPAVRTHAEDAGPDFQAGSPASDPGSPSTGMKEGKKSCSTGAVGRGRGRGSRGRGRPPHSGRGTASMPAPKGKAGPGRGHKGVKPPKAALLNASATAPAAVNTVIVPNATNAASEGSAAQKLMAVEAAPAGTQEGQTLVKTEDFTAHKAKAGAKDLPLKLPSPDA